MWWEIVTLTTLGYGDVIPLTAGGRAVGGIIGLLDIDSEEALQLLQSLLQEVVKSTLTKCPRCGELLNQH